MNRVLKSSLIVIAILVLAAAIMLSVGGMGKKLVYEGPIVDIPKLNEITASLQSGTPASYQIYKVDSETRLPIPNTISVTFPNGSGVTAKTVGFDKDGDLYSLRFEDNVLTGYMQLSDYESLLEAGLFGEWSDDKRTLRELFKAYSIEADLAIQQYQNATANVSP